MHLPYAALFQRQFRADGSGFDHTSLAHSATAAANFWIGRVRPGMLKLRLSGIYAISDLEIRKVSNRPDKGHVRVAGG
jgi:hypothetical protein